MANKQEVLDLHRQHPDLTSPQIAERLGCMPEYVRATLSRERVSKIKVKKRPGVQSTWTEEQLQEMIEKREIEKKSWSVIAKEIGRPLSTCSYQYGQYKQTNLAPRRGAPTKTRAIPERVLADAERRNMAERSLTSVFFGDPAPGQSALDKKQGAYA